MRRLSKNFLTLWVVLALVVTPLQAFTAGGDAAEPAAAPCASHSVAEADSGHLSHVAHHATANTPTPHCRGCCDRDCQHGDECTSQGCVAFHLQPATIGGASPYHAANSTARIPLLPKTVISRSDPPPLRPPV
jgi:hypothetical protein